MKRIYAVFVFVGLFNIGSVILCSEITSKNKYIKADKIDQIRSNVDNDQLLPVKVGGKWGYIDTAGNIVIKPQFDGAGLFLDGLAEVSINYKSGFISRDGKIVIEPQFGRIVYRDSSYGLIIVGVGDCCFIMGETDRCCKKGIIDKSGITILKPQFGVIDRFQDSIARVGVNCHCEFGICEKWGLINNMGNIIVEPQYEIREYGGAVFIELCINKGKVIVTTEDRTHRCKTRGVSGNSVFSERSFGATL